MARRTAPVRYVVVGNPTLACEKMGDMGENRVVSVPGARPSPVDHPHRFVSLAKVIVVIIALVMGHEEMLSYGQTKVTSSVRFALIHLPAYMKVKDE